MAVAGMLCIAAGGCQPKGTQPASKVTERIAALAADKGTSLDLQDVVVAPGDLKAIGTLTELRELRFGAWEAGDVSLEPIGRLQQLEVLWLGDAAIEDDSLKPVLQLTKLRVFNAQRTRLSDTGIALLAKLPRLELLRVGSPKITDDTMASLKDFPALRFVHFLDAPITDAGLSHVEKLDRLESLYLDRCKVSLGGCDRLRTVRPDLHLHVDDGG